MANVRTYTISGILIFLGILLIAVAGWACWQVRMIFIYVIVSAILAMITRPVENSLQRLRFGKLKLPRSIRALIILLIIYLVIYSFIAIFIPLLVDQATIISNVNTAQLTTAFHEPITQLENGFNGLAKIQSDTNTVNLDTYFHTGAGKLLDATKVSSLANGLVSFFGSLLIAFFAISFFTFFFIKDGAAIMEMLLLLIPLRRLKSVRNILDESQLMLRKYFTGVLIDVVFVAAFVSIGLFILGIKNAFIIGVFAGIMNIVPYVGPLIGGAFAIIIGASSNLTLDFYTGLLPLIQKIILVFVAMNLIDGFLVQPYIFSKRVKAHPIEIFLVVLVAGTLGGIGGMIVAVPLYTIIRIVAKEFLSKYRFVKRLTDDLETATIPVEKINPLKP